MDYFHVGCHEDSPCRNPSIIQTMHNKGILCKAVEKDEVDSAHDHMKCGADINSEDSGGKTAQCVAVHNSYPEKVEILIENGENANQADASEQTPKAPAAKSGQRDILQCYENGYENVDQIAEFFETEKVGQRSKTKGQERRNRWPKTANCCFPNESAPCNSNSSSFVNGSRVVKSTEKRVIIHKGLRKTKTPREQLGKLIILPDSLEELLRIGGKSSCLP